MHHKKYSYLNLFAFPNEQITSVGIVLTNLAKELASTLFYPLVPRITTSAPAQSLGPTIMEHWSMLIFPARRYFIPLTKNYALLPKILKRPSPNPIGITPILQFY
jgi:hypothetical protein